LGGITTGMSGFYALRIFLVVLILGFVFEWNKGALEWSSFSLSFFNFMTLFRFHRGNLHSKSMSTHAKAERPHHGYHLVDPSPWPALTRLCMLWLTVSLVLFFHQFSGAATVVTAALLSLTYTASLWWRDVNREGKLGFHTAKVQNGLHLGM
jgi:hypothetical protein